MAYVKSPLNWKKLPNFLFLVVPKAERNNIIEGKKINSLKLPNNDIKIKITDNKIKKNLLVIFKYK